MGFILLCLFAAIVLLGGLLSPSLPIALTGVCGLVAAGAGLATVWRVTRHWRLAVVFPDRLEFLRGPQRGVLPFPEVTAVHQLAWARSLFPYSRGHRVLVLVTDRAEWQVGNEIAHHEAFQEAVLDALRAFHERPGA